MANSEKSYRDRQGKAQMLHDAVSEFDPPYDPAVASLEAAAFQTFLTGSVEPANALVEALDAYYTADAATRVAMVKTLRETVTQALSYLRSNPAWASQYKAAKMAADKLRGVRPPRTPVPPPPDPPGPADGTRNRGEQAYVELAAHLGAFIAVVATCPGYAPPSAAITLAALTAAHTAFAALNGTLCASATGLSTAREARRLLYDRPGGLAEKFKLIKAAVKGQYGPNSAPWAVVEGIKW